MSFSHEYLTQCSTDSHKLEFSTKSKNEFSISFTGFIPDEHQATVSVGSTAGCTEVTARLRKENIFY